MIIRLLRIWEMEDWEKRRKGGELVVRIFHMREEYREEKDTESTSLVMILF